jgi:hypothetical protein
VSLPTLRQKVEIELGELRIVAAEVKRLLEKVERSQDLDYLGAIAMNLQSFYTGAERIFLLIARGIDLSIPTGDRWHQLLIEQMTMEIDAIRPLLLKEPTRLELDELRRFRHVARSLYAFRLNSDLVRDIAGRLPEVNRLLVEDCKQFFEQVQAQES